MNGGIRQTPSANGNETSIYSAEPKGAKVIPNGHYNASIPTRIVQERRPSKDRESMLQTKESLSNQMRTPVTASQSFSLETTVEMRTHSQMNGHSQQPHQRHSVPVQRSDSMNGSQSAIYQLTPQHRKLQPMTSGQPTGSNPHLSSTAIDTTPKLGSGKLGSTGSSQTAILQEEHFGVFASDEDPKLYQRR